MLMITSELGFVGDQLLRRNAAKPDAHTTRSHYCNRHHTVQSTARASEGERWARSQEEEEGGVGGFMLAEAGHPHRPRRVAWQRADIISRLL